jgi:hypothetical protein
MEPQVKYAKTTDGVNIAYYTLGSGPPFVWLTSPQSHKRHKPPVRAHYGHVAVVVRLVAAAIETRTSRRSQRSIAHENIEAIVRIRGHEVRRVRLERYTTAIRAHRRAATVVIRLIACATDADPGRRSHCCDCELVAPGSRPTLVRVTIRK